MFWSNPGDCCQRSRDSQADFGQGFLEVPESAAVHKIQPSLELRAVPRARRYMETYSKHADTDVYRYKTETDRANNRRSLGQTAGENESFF